MFVFSHEALETITDKQVERLLEFKAGHVETVTVHKGSPDLPAGYLYVMIKYSSGGPVIHGGISPEGEMST